MAIDWKFIREKEGSSTRGYVPNPQTSNSGVTVGAGVDLGQRTPAEIDALAISEALKAKLKPYAGYRKAEAVTYLAQHPLQLTEPEVEELDAAIQTPMVKNLASTYNRALAADQPGLKPFDDLPDAIQTAIASVAFQYGVNLASRTPRFWSAVTTQNWAAAIHELENFGDAYQTRRLSEAALIRNAADGIALA